MGLDLVTLAEYKAYAGISSVNQDTMLNAIIPKVSSLVKNICNRTFIDYVNDDKVSIFRGGDYLSPLETPLIAVKSVEYSADYGNTYTSLIEFVDYTWDQETDSIFPINSNAGQVQFHSTFSGSRYNPSVPVFPKIINGYRVTYNGGFDPLPIDLKLAVMDLVTYYLKHENAVHSPKAPGSNMIQIDYITGGKFPSAIQRILDLYCVYYN